MKNLIKGIIIHTALFTTMLAQDSTAGTPQHLLGLFSGLSNHIVRDDIISPLLYSGSQFPILVSYTYRGQKSREMYTAYYENLQLSSSITNTLLLRMRSMIRRLSSNTGTAEGHSQSQLSIQIAIWVVMCQDF